MKTIFALSATSMALTAFAENGLDYRPFLVCTTPNGEVRFDNYAGYGHGDGYRQHVQAVFLGEMSEALQRSGLYPTKPSSVQGEFIVDRLERDLVDGFDFATRSAPGGNEFFTVLLSQQGGILVVTKYYGRLVDKEVRFSGVSCQLE
jgi:hypothetical protein